MTLSPGWILSTFFSLQIYFSLRVLTKRLTVGKMGGGLLSKILELLYGRDISAQCFISKLL